MGPLKKGEISDGARLREVLDRYQAVALMHFAAFAYAGESVLYYNNKFGGSITLFRAIIETPTIPVVSSSTCATYGALEKVPFLEEHPQRPINPYGWMLTDPTMRMACGQSRCAISTPRVPTPMATSERRTILSPILIPRILAAALDGTPVTIFGDDYETADGTCIRDYVRVADIAEALSSLSSTSCQWPELRAQPGQCAELFSHGRDPSRAARYREARSC